ncbi:MAG: sensor domain-containing phosphodiesterase [Eubacterium sp.]|nr:sensor domain-containing phosphodiesterase [Eubacterium sp.]
MNPSKFQCENELIRRELEAEEFILEQIAILNKVNTLEECAKNTINMLASIGDFTKSDRAYIFEKDGEGFSNTYEWCARDIESQMDELQGLTMKHMPYWIPVLSEGKSIFVDDLEKVKDVMPVEYEILRVQNIQSVKVFPITVGDTLKGFIGLDNPRVQSSEITLRLLSTLGGYYGIKNENLKMYSALDYSANYDPITDTYNRLGFYRHAEQLLRDYPDEQFSMVISDIKNFELMNEILGEDIADSILRDEAEWLKERQSKKSVLGRLYSDIFAYLVPTKKLKEEEMMSLVSYLNEKYNYKKFKLHIYFGIYHVLDKQESVRQMADKAIHAVEKLKGNLHQSIAYYDEKDFQDALLKQQLIGEFDNGIKEKQFCMYLQPQTNEDGKMQGAEALVRWNHPTRGLLMPGQFIEAFEEAGLIYKLDQYMWNLAAKKLRDWSDAGYDYYISVNISAKDFYRMNVYKTFLSIVEENEIDPGKLHIEITESAVAEDEVETHRTLEKLRDKGFIIEIDDFGSGYSSLNFMKNVCANVIKIDRVFLKESSNETRGEQILSSIIRLSHEIGMEVITEGVENPEQLRMLIDMCCDLYQGYYFSKPLEIIDFEKKYDIAI